jgi:hypothetical protein
MWDSIAEEIVLHVSKPETRALIDAHVLRPILQSIYNHVYPYVIGILLLWILMFCCLAMILILLVRGSLLDILVRKENLHQLVSG